MKIPDDCKDCLATSVCGYYRIIGGSSCVNFHKALESKLHSHNNERDVNAAFVEWCDNENIVRLVMEELSVDNVKLVFQAGWAAASTPVL